MSFLKIHDIIGVGDSVGISHMGGTPWHVEGMYLNEGEERSTRVDAFIIIIENVFHLGESALVVLIAQFMKKKRLMIDIKVKKHIIELHIVEQLRSL